MGSVYLAQDVQLDRPVALKVPNFGLNDGSRLRERFFREARAAATLSHPNLCPVYDVGEVDGILYLTMAYVEGRPLTDYIRPGKPLPERQAAALVRRLALALQEAHGRGVIHRDLKPANIMITPRREPVIMDFGLARQTSKDESRLTQHGAVLGTPGYMPPEQVRGELDAMGPACDIYSLGVILYEALTGRLPFEGTSLAVLAKIITEAPPPPTTVRADLDPRLEQICLRAMAKEPAQRYASMAELATALAEYLRAPSPGSASRRGATLASAAETEQEPDESLTAQLFAEISAAREATAPRSPTRRSGERKRRSKPSAARRTYWPWILGAAAAAFLVVVALGIVVLVQTSNGTIRIELDGDASGAEITVDGDEVSIAGLKEPIKLRAGKHHLFVSGKDFETVSESFTVKNGSNPVLRVTLQPKPAELAKRPESPPPPPRSALEDGGNLKPSDKSTGGPSPHVPQPISPHPKPTPVRPASFFNGKNLEGWEGLQAHWRVQDGTLIGSTYPNGINFNTFLCSTTTYKDFELRCQVRLSGRGWEGNSGVQIRSSILDPARYIVAGPQCAMGGEYWGSLYGEHLGGMMHQSPQDLVSRVMKRGQFNDYHIKVVGKHVTIRLNGATTVDDDFATLPAEGIIAWELPAGGPMEVAIKSIDFKELDPSLATQTAKPPEEFRSLFNYIDLQDWRMRDGKPASWKVGNGYVEVVPRRGDIRTIEKFGPDFQLKLDFWLPRLAPQVKGQARCNSGVFLQGRYEVQVLDSYRNPTNDKGECGALYGLIGTSKNASKPPEQWQSLDIEFHAPRVDIFGKVTRKGRITVVLNGQTVINQGEFDRTTGMALDNNLGEPGPILLQEHGSAVRFRNLRIRPLEPVP
jgi:hypothetical protein